MAVPAASSSRHPMVVLEGPPETLRTSPQYFAEGFEGDSQFDCHQTDDNKFPVVSNYQLNYFQSSIKLQIPAVIILVIYFN